MDKKDIKSLSLLQLQQEFAALSEEPYRAKQVYDWLHRKLAASFDEMTNLSKKFIEKLKENYSIVNLKPVKVLTSGIDGTKKYLFELWDSHVIESVLMKYSHGNSVCISTQVGCRMGCEFCASAIGGLTRNLYPSEMLEQVYQIQRLSAEKVSHVVLMGTGEPLDNYDNVLKFVKMISDENGLHISQRNITISTCAVVPIIRKLADEKLQVTLAISLHASDNETRKNLMPIATRYSIEEILDACKEYFHKTKRRLTFEYSLLSNVNDGIEDARMLAKLLRGINCHVNLIPVNPVKEREYRPTKKSDVDKFRDELLKSGINVTIRRELGRDIHGACGQLRKAYNKVQKDKEERA